jgi:class 3 adenylate cyclase
LGKNGSVEALPETRYTKTADGVHLAYSVFGDGRDLIWVPPSYSHIEACWGDDGLARWLRRMATFARVISFDKRGSGLSDPVPGRTVPAPEEWMDDIRCVLDTVGSTRAALFGQEAGGPVSMLFAVTHPERTSALVLANSFARLARASDYPWGIPHDVQKIVLENIEARWGRYVDVMLGPDATEEQRQSTARLQRFAVSPGVAVESFRTTFHIDVRRVLPIIQVPTLVIHSAQDRYIRVDHGRHLAEHIPGARYIELPAPHALWATDQAAIALDEMEEFLTGVRGGPSGERVLATLLFTDIVSSTEHAVRLGDAKWTKLLDEHDAVVERELSRQRGRKVNPTGDGLLATFDGPARAIRCAQAICRSVRSLGIEVRAGLHTGEVELRGQDIGGVAVHLAQRVSALARPNEVLVSRTVTDLVAGSGIEFDDHGEHELKGVPGTWRLYAAID